MASSRRTVYLIAFTYSSTQRRHFGLLIPKLENGEESNTDGTLIHAVGAPMTGFNLEFKRSYNHETSRTRHELYNLGTVPVSVINQLTEQPHQRMQRLQPAPQTILEVLAFIVPLPQRAPVNEPVNNTTHRRCQEWTTDLVKMMVSKNWLHHTAVDRIEDQRDPPTHGIPNRRNYSRTPPSPRSWRPQITQEMTDARTVVQAWEAQQQEDSDDSDDEGDDNNDNDGNNDDDDEDEDDSDEDDNGAGASGTAAPTNTNWIWNAEAGRYYRYVNGRAVWAPTAVSSSSKGKGRKE